MTFHDFTSQGADDWHLFVGRERGVCRTAKETLDVAFRTTRWFVRRDGGWRQLHHHGSVEDPKMLADYQNRSSDKENGRRPQPAPTAEALPLVAKFAPHQRHNAGSQQFDRTTHRFRLEGGGAHLEGDASDPS